MIDQRLFIYIEQELKRGVPNAAIKNALREAGWTEEAVGQAFVAVQGRNVPPRPVQELPEEKISPSVSKYKIIKKSGKKLPLGMIITIVAVIVAVLAGAGYVLFAVPERQEEAGALDDTDYTILKKENSDSITSGEASEETAKLPDGKEAGEDSAAMPLAASQSEEDPGLSDSKKDEISADAKTVQPENMLQNDAKRKEDLGKLAAAQKLWLNDHGAYYTCGLSGGDCGGKAYGFPEQIGVYLSKTEQDPMFGNNDLTKAVCGKDYVYCGLNNTPYSEFFCYYAKLESGGYYTVSHAGSAVRSLVPKVFEECGIAE